jgi:hypothetical protein
VVAELSSPDAETPGGISGDKLTILIESNRAGGSGGVDLYIATRMTPVDPWSTPVGIAELNTASTDTQSWLAENGLVIYFDSNRDGPDFDLYFAERSSITTPFGAPMPVTELNTTDFESDAALSADLRYIMFTVGPSAQPREIYEAFR